MKFSISLILLSFFFLNVYSQNTTLQDSTKNNTIVKEKTRKQCFELDGDDIYAGKNKTDSIEFLEETYNESYLVEDTYEEDIYEKRTYTSHVMEVILNVGLLFLWVFTHY